MNLEEISAVLTPIVEGLGYEIVDIDYKRRDGDMTLRLYIWCRAGITLDDCEKVHRAIDPVIDELDPSNGESYVLQVSSPGLDRPIVTDRDYERAMDTEIEVLLNALVERKKKWAGKLISFDSENITLMVNNKKIIINRALIKVCQPYIKF